MLARVGLFVMVQILGMSSGLRRISAIMSDSFINFGELTMALGQGHLNSVSAIKKYNQLL